MKTQKIIIIALLLWTLCLTKAFAYDFSAVCDSGQTLYYNVIDTTNHYVELTFAGTGYHDPWTNYTKPEGNLVLPTNVSINNTTYSVTQIGKRAFYECTSISSVSIPNSVTSVEHESFFGCSGIDAINIPNTVSSFERSALEGTGWYNNQSDGVLYLNDWCLGYKGDKPIGQISILNGTKHLAGRAFEYCDSLILISMPDSMTSIGQSAFRGSGLSSIFIPESVFIIGDYAFSMCYDLVSVNIPNSVTSIGDYTFWECNSLSSITIPNTVTSIGRAAFHNCNSLTALTIPSSVVSIFKNPFYGCSKLETIIVDESNTVYDSRENCNAIIETETNQLIVGSKNTNIPNTVLSIGYRAFWGCLDLTSIVIPNSVVKICESSFCKCSSITSITIPNSVTDIEEDAFFRCDSLKKVISFCEEPPTLGSCAFGNLDSWNSNEIPELIVLCGCKDAYEQSDWNNYFETIEEDCEDHTITVIGDEEGRISVPSQARLGDEITIETTANLEPDCVLYSVIVCKVDDETWLVPVWDNKFTMPNFDVIVKPQFSHTLVDENGNIPVAIYPNPVKDKVTIEAENIKHVSISNVMGQLIYEGLAEGDSFEYDFSSQEAGVYLIRIETSNGMVSKRIVVTK
jgi:hypothetical protein